MAVGSRMSALISPTAVIWSGVSWYGNDSSNSICQLESSPYAMPPIAWRFA